MRTASMTGSVVGSAASSRRRLRHLEVELAPEHLGLRVEVAEERAPADAGLGGDLVDGRVVEALLGEQTQRDDLELARARAGRPSAPGFAVRVLLFRHAMTLTYAAHSALGDEIDLDARSRP